MSLPVMKDGEFTGSYVKYNSNLDFLDGRNHTSGQPGKHLGITKLRKKKSLC